MDKTAKKTLNKKLVLPFIVALIGVVVMVAAMFLMNTKEPSSKLWRKKTSAQTRLSFLLAK